ncbi:MAG TPA: energy transducer TonB, partial [Thermoanaerobaculia bacterium]|nr:energy transducer TonB [Thermoanaerobaculia bacterium]
MDPAFRRRRQRRGRRTVLARTRSIPFRFRGRPAQVTGAAAGAVLLAALGCASAGGARPLDRPDSCPAFTAARPKFPRLPEYPPTARRARMSGESTHELVVDRDGKVRELRIVGTTFMIFALSAEEALRKSTYFPAELEGRPVASRFWARIPFGIPPGVESSPARNRVTAFVPGDEPARARWQLSAAIRR